MNHWPFIVAAYGFVLLGTAAVIAVSYKAMRSAEDNVDRLGKNR